MKKIFIFFLRFIPRPWLIRLSYLVSPVFALWLRGDTYIDPIDGKGYKSFLPYGYEKQRPNVLAPGTLSLERHRLLWLFLKNETDFFSKSQKVLHFAPEQAFYKRFRKLKHLDYTTTDLNSPLADVKADICDLPFEDDTYDTIFCNHVLEHIPNDKKAMQELYRILKPGGMAILQVPQELDREKTFEDATVTDPKERARIFGQYDHVRVYGQDYFDLLRAVGFKVVPYAYTSTTSELLANTFRLAPGELLPVCYK